MTPKPWAMPLAKPSTRNIRQRVEPTGGESLLAEIASDNNRIYHIIELLEQIAEQNRNRK